MSKLAGFEVRAAEPADYGSVADVLKRNSLPSDDLDERLTGFSIGHFDGNLAGFIGVQPAGDAALLRSLAVVPEYQKQGVGAKLVKHAIHTASAAGISDLYLLTLDARRYFQRFGFLLLPRADAPPEIRETQQYAGLCPESALLMWRRTDGELIKEIGEQAEDLFNLGYFCAESVLIALSGVCVDVDEIDPRLATGFCSGIARTANLCGAVSGAVMALNRVTGRTSRFDSVELNYEVVKQILDRFETRFGSVNCRDLLGCDLGCEQGQKEFQDGKLWRRCREFTGAAASMTGEILAAQESLQFADNE